jgi:peroxiredoxin
MIAMNLGDRVPDLTLQRPGGGTIALRDFLGKPLLLVFLRHLA